MDASRCPCRADRRVPKPRRGVVLAIEGQGASTPFGVTASPRAARMYARNRGIKAVSAIPVLLVVTLFSFEWYVYNFVFMLSKMAKPSGNESLHRQAEIGITSLDVARAVLFNAVWLLAFWSFFRCSLSDPGLVPEEWRLKLERETSIRPSRPPPGRTFCWQPGTHTMCRHCHENRPERAHHCRVCGRCVLRMDHHCPWVGNCVGFKNHKFFILMNFYGALACLMFVLSSLHQLKALFFGGSRMRLFGVFDSMMFSLAGILAASFGISLSLLFAAHCWLLLKNLTSVEVAFVGSNPYSLGPLHNAQQILGAPDLTWLLPIHPAKPMADGCSWPTIGSTASHDADELVSIIGASREDPQADDDV